MHKSQVVMVMALGNRILKESERYFKEIWGEESPLGYDTLCYYRVDRVS